MVRLECFLSLESYPEYYGFQCMAHYSACDAALEVFEQSTVSKQSWRQCRCTTTQSLLMSAFDKNENYEPQDQAIQTCQKSREA